MPTTMASADGYALAIYGNRMTAIDAFRTCEHRLMDIKAVVTATLHSASLHNSPATIANNSRS